jgi:hypothetical protein
VLDLNLVAKPSHRLSLDQAVNLKVTVQLCSESQCLLPQVKTLLV